jgi:hypothetical protein
VRDGRRVDRQHRHQHQQGINCPRIRHPYQGLGRQCLAWPAVLRHPRQ